MSNGQDLAIEELMKSYRDALVRAEAFRKIALAQPTPEQAAEYRQQARFEMDKADGYLRHANSLRKTEMKENERVA